VTATKVKGKVGAVSLFVVDGAGTVQTLAFDGGWGKWYALNGVTFPARAALSVVSPRNGGVSVFGVDGNGLVQTVSYDGGWGSWYPLSGATFPARTAVTAVSTAVSTAGNAPPDNVYVLAVGGDGSVQTVEFDPSSGWGQWRPILPASKTFANRPVVTAVSAVPGGVSLFATDASGAVWTAYLDPRVSQNWQGWFAIHAETTFSARPVVAATAVSSRVGAVRLFLSADTGTIETTAYDPAGSQWPSWLPVN
jgi:hypothetical protein